MGPLTRRLAMLRDGLHANPITKLTQKLRLADASPLFTQMKSLSASTPNTPLRANPKPNFNRIISLSPSVLYGLDQHVVSVDLCNFFPASSKWQVRHKIRPYMMCVCNVAMNAIVECAADIAGMRSRCLAATASTGPAGPGHTANKHRFMLVQLTILADSI